MDIQDGLAKFMKVLPKKRMADLLAERQAGKLNEVEAVDKQLYTFAEKLFQERLCSSHMKCPQATHNSSYTPKPLLVNLTPNTWKVTTRIHTQIHAQKEQNSRDKEYSSQHNLREKVKTYAINWQKKGIRALHSLISLRLLKTKESTHVL